MSKLQTLVHTLKMKAVLPRQRVRIGLFTVLDNKCQFEHHIHIDRFCTLHHTSIGAYSYISYYSSASDCTIGKFCSIGTGVYIGLPIHPLDRVSTSPTFYAANKTGKCFYVDTTVEESRHTTVGNDVWIGSNALIMGGVNIGHGAVIAAAAVVTKDVPPYAVVAGLPAKIISYRYDDETIAALLKMKWWDLDDRVLEKLAPSFKNAGNLISEFDSFVSQGGGDQDADTSY